MSQTTDYLPFFIKPESYSLQQRLAILQDISSNKIDKETFQNLVPYVVQLATKEKEQMSGPLSRKLLGNIIIKSFTYDLSGIFRCVETFHKPLSNSKTSLHIKLTTIEILSMIFENFGKKIMSLYPETILLLQKQCKNSDSHLRSTALIALTSCINGAGFSGTMSHAEILKGISSCFNDKTPNVRIQIPKLLSSIINNNQTAFNPSSENILKRLIKGLNDKDVLVRKENIESLGGLFAACWKQLPSFEEEKKKKEENENESDEQSFEENQKSGSKKRAKNNKDFKAYDFEKDSKNKKNKNKNKKNKKKKHQEVLDDKEELLKAISFKKIPELNNARIILLKYLTKIFLQKNNNRTKLIGLSIVWTRFLTNLNQQDLSKNTEIFFNEFEIIGKQSNFLKGTLFICLKYIISNFVRCLDEENKLKFFDYLSKKLLKTNLTEIYLEELFELIGILKGSIITQIPTLIYSLTKLNFSANFKIRFSVANLYGKIVEVNPSLYYELTKKFCQLIDDLLVSGYSNLNQCYKLDGLSLSLGYVTKSLVKIAQFQLSNFFAEKLFKISFSLLKEDLTKDKKLSFTEAQYTNQSGWTILNAIIQTFPDLTLRNFGFFFYIWDEKIKFLKKFLRKISNNKKYQSVFLTIVLGILRTLLSFLQFLKRHGGKFESTSHMFKQCAKIMERVYKYIICFQKDGNSKSNHKDKNKNKAKTKSSNLQKNPNLKSIFYNHLDDLFKIEMLMFKIYSIIPFHLFIPLQNNLLKLTTYWICSQQRKTQGCSKLFLKAIFKNKYPKYNFSLFNLKYYNMTNKLLKSTDYFNHFDEENLEFDDDPLFSELSIQLNEYFNRVEIQTNSLKQFVVDSAIKLFCKLFLIQNDWEVQQSTLKIFQIYVNNSTKQNNFNEQNFYIQKNIFCAILYLINKIIRKKNKHKKFFNNKNKSKNKNNNKKFLGNDPKEQLGKEKIIIEKKKAILKQKQETLLNQLITKIEKEIPLFLNSFIVIIQNKYNYNYNNSNSNSNNISRGIHDLQFLFIEICSKFCYLSQNEQFYSTFLNNYKSQYLQKKILKNNQNNILISTHSLLLGTICKSMGIYRANSIFASSVLNLIQNCKSSFINVSYWSLFSLKLLIDSLGTSFIQMKFITPVVDVINYLLMSNNHNHNLNILIIISQLIISLANLFGPELKSKSTRVKWFMMIFKYLYSIKNEAINYQSLLLLDKLCLYDAINKELNYNEIVSIVNTNLIKKKRDFFFLNKYTCLTILSKLILKFEEKKNISNQEFSKFFNFNFLKYKLFELIDFFYIENKKRKETNIIKEIRLLLEKIIEKSIFINLFDWLNIFKKILLYSSKDTKKLFSMNSKNDNNKNRNVNENYEDNEDENGDGDQDEDEVGGGDKNVYNKKENEKKMGKNEGQDLETVSIVSEKENELINTIELCINRSPCWQTKKLVMKIFQIFIKQIIEKNNVNIKNKLIKNLQDMIELSFKCSTSVNYPVRLVGLKSIQLLIKCFLNIPDPEYNENLILEVYENQITTSLKQSFSFENFIHDLNFEENLNNNDKGNSKGNGNDDIMIEDDDDGGGGDDNDDDDESKKKNNQANWKHLVLLFHPKIFGSGANLSVEIFEFYKEILNKHEFNSIETVEKTLKLLINLFKSLNLVENTISLSKTQLLILVSLSKSIIFLQNSKFNNNDLKSILNNHLITIYQQIISAIRNYTKLLTLSKDERNLQNEQYFSNLSSKDAHKILKNNWNTLFLAMIYISKEKVLIDYFNNTNDNLIERSNFFLCFGICIYKINSALIDFNNLQMYLAHFKIFLNFSKSQLKNLNILKPNIFFELINLIANIIQTKNITAKNQFTSLQILELLSQIIDNNINNDYLHILTNYFNIGNILLNLLKKSNSSNVNNDNHNEDNTKYNLINIFNSSLAIFFKKFNLDLKIKYLPKIFQLFFSFLKLKNIEDKNVLLELQNVLQSEDLTNESWSSLLMNGLFYFLDQFKIQNDDDDDDDVNVKGVNKVEDDSDNLILIKILQPFILALNFSLFQTQISKKIMTTFEKIIQLKNKNSYLLINSFNNIFHLISSNQNFNSQNTIIYNLLIQLVSSFSKIILNKNNNLDGFQSSEDMQLFIFESINLIANGYKLYYQNLNEKQNSSLLFIYLQLILIYDSFNLNQKFFTNKDFLIDNLLDIVKLNGLVFKQTLQFFPRNQQKILEETMKNHLLNQNIQRGGDEIKIIPIRKNLNSKKKIELKMSFKGFYKKK
ncbi:sorting of apical protein [Anaeramoeba flamelloides]|uniref:Sorting of apical protein n=1 Tax=Anaeramoeba flamelloides TaxID=1746091 RepID=A0AAV8ADZ4_9EUKA|nr:sorting of apical protein [Anaeramoeba flamelloides]